MRYTCVIGIDPGSTGAAVVIDRARNVTEIRFAKANQYALAVEFSLNALIHKPWALMELTHGRECDDVVGAYVFGRNAGRIEGFMFSNGIPLDYVDPQEWKKHYSLLSYEYDEGKRLARDKAKILFPGSSPILDTGDAYLLADLAWQIMFGGKTNATLLSDSVPADVLNSSVRRLRSKHGTNRKRSPKRYNRDT